MVDGAVDTMVVGTIDTMVDGAIDIMVDGAIDTLEALTERIRSIGAPRPLDLSIERAIGVLHQSVLESIASNKFVVFCLTAPSC